MCLCSAKLIVLAVAVINVTPIPGVSAEGATDRVIFARMSNKWFSFSRTQIQLILTRLFLPCVSYLYVLKRRLAPTKKRTI
jgi:hypothetical protein